MAFNIGVNVVEVDGAGAPSITGAATSVGAFNIMTERGVPDEPARVTSFAEFVDRFGGYYPGGHGAYLVSGFFANGGRAAYVNRVCGPATPATGTLADAAGKAVLTVEAGSRGKADPGAWGGQLRLRVTPSSGASSPLRQAAPATVTGTALGADVDMSTASTLAVTVDGAPAPIVLRFAPADFLPHPDAVPRAQLVDAINRQTHLLVAGLGGEHDDQLVLTSTGELGASWTSLQVTAAQPALGLSAMSSPVLGTAEPFTAGGASLARPVGFAPGDAVVLTAGDTSASTTLLTVDDATGGVTWAPPVDVATFRDLHEVTVASAEFDLVVSRGGDRPEDVVETWPGLSMERGQATYAPRVLNHPLSGSRYVRVVDVGATVSPAALPAATEGTVALTPGADGTPLATHFAGDPAAGTGFHAFTPYDVQLVCCERTDKAVAVAGLAYCAGRGDALFVGAVPEGAVAAGLAVGYGKELQAKNAYGALYGPWILVPDPIGVGDTPRVTIPPVGHVMGVFARIEATRGIWKAPAGDEANLLGVLDVETRLSDADHTELVVDGAVNGVRAVPRAGIVVDASRTLSSDPRWRYVNVRLLFNYVKVSLRDGLRWVRQEPNRDSLWSAVKHGTVTPFLMGMWRQGAFGTGNPDQTFTVIVDATNNPPDQVEQGRLNVEVYFYPSRPAETIVITVGQRSSGATAAES